MIYNRILGLIVFLFVSFCQISEAQYRYLMINTNDSTLNVASVTLPSYTTLNGNQILTNPSLFDINGVATNAVYGYSNFASVAFYSANNPSNYVTQIITNGLATVSYVTNKIALATNGLVTSSVTNGLVTQVNITSQLGSYYLISNPSNYVAQYITNGLASTNYVNNSINNIPQVTSTQTVQNIISVVSSTGNYYSATIVIGLQSNLIVNAYPNSNPSNYVPQNITNGFVTSSVTNGLASVVYVDNATQNLAQISITNSLATVPFVTNQINILSVSDSNYVNSATNNLWIATTNLNVLSTNGLAKTSYVTNQISLSTQGLASVSYVTNQVALSTQNVAQTSITNGFVTSNITNGLASVGLVTSATNGIWVSVSGLNTVTNNGSAVLSYVVITNNIGQQSIIEFGNTNNYYEHLIVNLNTGNNASADYTVQSSDGSSTNWYVDYGMNNTNGASTPFTNSHDAYLYSSDGPLKIGAGMNGRNTFIGFYVSNSVIPILLISNAVVYYGSNPVLTNEPIGTIALTNYQATLVSATNGVYVSSTNFTTQTSNSLFVASTNKISLASISSTNYVNAATNSLYNISTNFTVQTSNNLWISITNLNILSTNGLAKTSYVTNQITLATQGLAQVSVTNGLATTNYVTVLVVNSTQNIVQVSITNELATTNYVNSQIINSTQNIIQASVTNGLASIIFVTNQINIVANSSTNYVNTVTQNVAQLSITNGLATTNFTIQTSNNLWVANTNLNTSTSNSLWIATTNLVTSSTNSITAAQVGAVDLITYSNYVYVIDPSNDANIVSNLFPGLVIPYTNNLFINITNYDNIQDNQMSNSLVAITTNLNTVLSNIVSYVIVTQVQMYAGMSLPITLQTNSLGQLIISATNNISGSFQCLNGSTPITIQTDTTWTNLYNNYEVTLVLSLYNTSATALGNGILADATYTNTSSVYTNIITLEKLAGRPAFTAFQRIAQ